MKVNMLTSMHGPNVAREIGDEVEMPKDEAERLIARGYAEPVGGKGDGDGEKPSQRRTRRTSRQAEQAAKR